MYMSNYRQSAESGRTRVNHGQPSAPAGITIPVLPEAHPLQSLTGLEAAAGTRGGPEPGQKRRAARARPNRNALVRKARARKLIERKKDQARLRQEIEELW
jgi:hypothetical protein